MNEQDLVYRLLKRAEIRRSITTRKSVVEGYPDRIADLLEEAAAEIQKLRGLCESKDCSWGDRHRVGPWAHLRWWVGTWSTHWVPSCGGNFRNLWSPSVGSGVRVFTMKITNHNIQTCVVVWCDDYHSYRVWSSGIIECWDERSRSWRYHYDITDDQKNYLWNYSKPLLFHTWSLQSKTV